MRSDRPPHVAVIGGGFSGAMAAIHLIEADCAVTLIERSERIAGGLAYGTPESRHLLNVRAGNMGALPNAPGHFAEWLAAQDRSGPADFAPRATYRSYLADLFGRYRGRLRVVEGEALRWREGTCVLASVETVAADATVIAAGNLPPEPLAMYAGLGELYLNEPWSAKAQASIARAAADGREVLLIGTGLTAVDAVLSLDAHGFAGRVTALSRRGLLPRAHADAGAAAQVPPAGPLAMLRAVRREAGASDWRGVVDALRPVTASIWRSWTVAERGRFLRHLRPWWDVHRHRIAPEVAARLAALRGEDRLRVAAGRVVGVDGEMVRVRYRGRADEESIEPGLIVNCTGPQGDLRRSRDPLIADLLRSGAATCDPFGLGLDVDPDCRVVGARGLTPGLYAVGPITKGAFWESVAVPDIRVQAAELARTIADDLRAVPLDRAAS